MEKPCKLSWSSIDNNGYSRVPGDGKTLAHRNAWEKAFGPIPEGMLVCHHCDVRNCIEPTHLFLGTYKDNLEDASKKGRLKRIPKTHCKVGHKLTPENTNGRRRCKICERRRARNRYYDY